jgi:DNA invertase Pin-like site-specific DNA recombinase
MEKVYGYARVSTRGQAEEGVSLEAQESRIRAYALAKGWDLTDVLVERAKSGKNTRRPMLERLRGGVRAGEVSTVIVLRLDRISRSVRDLLDLLDEFDRKKVTFVSINESLDTGTSMGRFVYTLLGAVAELERSTIADRTVLALKHKRQKGEVYSRVPFGWKQEGERLEQVPSEQRALAAARKMRAEGASFQAIADYFMEHGVKPHGGGKKWYPASARQVLRSKMALEVA